MVEIIRKLSPGNRNSTGASLDDPNSISDLPQSRLPWRFLNWCYRGLDCSRKEQLNHEYRKAECHLWVN